MFSNPSIYPRGGVHGAVNAAEPASLPLRHVLDQMETCLNLSTSLCTSLASKQLVDFVLQS